MSISVTSTDDTVKAASSTHSSSKGKRKHKKTKSSKHTETAESPSTTKKSNNLFRKLTGSLPKSKSNKASTSDGVRGAASSTLVATSALEDSTNNIDVTSVDRDELPTLPSRDPFSQKMLSEMFQQIHLAHAYLMAGGQNASTEDEAVVTPRHMEVKVIGPNLQESSRKEATEALITNLLDNQVALEIPAWIEDLRTTDEELFNAIAAQESAERLTEHQSTSLKLIYRSLPEEQYQGLQPLEEEEESQDTFSVTSSEE